MLYAKFARINLGLAQHEVARRARIPRLYVSQIENGRVNPTPSELQQLAKALGVDDASRLTDHVSESSLGAAAEYRDAQRERR